MADNAKAILAKAKEIGCTIVLPTDFVVASGLEDGVNAATIEEVPEDKMILDIGPESTKAVIAVLKDCRTVIWNGPLGAFEYTPFDKSTMEIAKEVAASVQAGKLICVAGGGDTVSALKKAGVEDKMTYVSSAGGAFLEWMEGKILPGVKALA